MKARVFLAPEEVSLAIGKNGLNIKLASLLTGFTIDVFRDSRDAAMDEEDVNLEEFSDEIDAWIIDAIKALGYNTAKQVLRAPRERLVNEADLEEEQADEVLSILAREFANGDESWNNAPAAPSAADLEALKAKFQG